MKPIDTRCEYLNNPIGIDEPKPRFYWRLEANKRAQLQTAYQIIVSTTLEKLKADIGDKWDSGMITGDLTSHVEYGGSRLESCKRYWWKVCYWDADGIQSEFSETAYFEMGLLEEADWNGHWIGADENIASPLLRKTFSVDENIKNARVYISGLGYYELYINGNRIGDHVLDPNWTNYDDRDIKGLLYPFDDKTSKTVLYVTYDVTEYIQQGDNTIGVMLGNGWYNQRERTVEGQMWFGSPKLLLQLNIELQNGVFIDIASDESWKYLKGPIIFNNIFYGEVYDARLETKGWSSAGFDDAGWNFAKKIKKPTGVLRSQMSPPDKIIDTIIPTKISNPKSGVFIYDMGRNITGWVKLKISGQAGSKVVLKFAEELDAEGMLDFSSAGGLEQVQSDTYILKGVEDEVFEPRFTWHGFRYVEITGSPEQPDIKNIKGKVIHAAVERTGFFECSNPLFNKIQECYINSQLSNLHGGVPSDCPHRERLGYTGDGQITAEAAILNLNMAPFYTKWIRDISDAQNRETGFVPHTAPFNGGGGGPAWGCAVVIVPWMLYMYYGDKRILEKNYAVMKRWVDYLSACTDGNNIIITEEPGSWFLGDWCTPGGFDALKPPQELVSTFYYSYVCGIMQKVAKILDQTDDEGLYRNLTESVNEAFNDKFYNSDTNAYSIGSRGTDAFPLALGIVSEENRAKVLEHFLKNLMEVNSGHFDTGIFGTKFLFDVLTEYGYGSIAYNLLNTRTYPGFGYMIESGATTLWENWEGNASHNHPMFGSVCAWFYKALAGINLDPAEPGFKKIIIKPCFLEDLSYVNASIMTLMGKLQVNWERKENAIKMNLVLPVNTSSQIYIPLSIMKQSVIIENEQIVLSKGDLAYKPEGLLSLKEDRTNIIFELLSGEYEFEIY